MAHVRIMDLPSKEIAPGITLRSVYLQNLMVTFVHLERDAVLPVHAHPHEQITTVIDGALDFTLDGARYSLIAGDAITIPSGATHSAVAINGPCTVYDSWNPVRRDYIIQAVPRGEGGEACALPDGNPPSGEIVRLLQRARTIAVVGLSDNPARDSHEVALYLKDHGYRIIPVNPAKETILGEISYPDLSSIPEKIDVVDIFRQVDAIPGIVDEAIKAGAGAIWMQLGLAHAESARKARAAGLVVVQSKCMKIEHSRMTGGYHAGGIPGGGFKLSL
jgi:uncharacterized protein